MMINLVLAKQQHLIVYFKMPAKTFFFRTAAFQTPSQSSLSLKFRVVRDTEGQTIGNEIFVHLYRWTKISFPMVCPSVSLTTRNFNESEDWEVCTWPLRSPTGLCEVLRDR